MTLIETFEAEGADGRRYTIEVYSPMTAHRPLAGSAKGLAGSLTYQLIDGGHVNPSSTDPNKFTIFDTDEVIRRV